MTKILKLNIEIVFSDPEDISHGETIVKVRTFQEAIDAVMVNVGQIIKQEITSEKKCSLIFAWKVEDAIMA